MKQDYLEHLRQGKTLTTRQQLLLTIQLSIPAIMAQISSVVMQYIDASMVGHLGANESASIGLMSSSTWLMGGLCSAAAIGYTVQIAHHIGAGDEKGARNIVRQGIMTALLFSLLLLAVGAFLSPILPGWLGGTSEICDNAFKYFLIYALSLPFIELNRTAGGMLQCSGNMKIPSILNIVMCGLDVIFNWFFIFPTRSISIGNLYIKMPGAGLGVAGASLGTAMSEAVIACVMLFFLLVRSEKLHLRRNEHLHFSSETLKRAVKMSLPVGFENLVMCGAYIAQTKIVAPLGTIAIAANSFAVTAESLCYMPGYGIGTAATTLIGQSIGAGRKDLTKRLGWLTTGLGMLGMACTGALMFVLAPWMMRLLSPDPAICELGTMVLRIEAFAEPFYGASIVASGVFRGAGDTLVPSCMNFFSMWAVRIVLSSILAPILGLRGVWIAMCVELCVRGIIFLIRLMGKRWQISFVRG